MNTKKAVVSIFVVVAMTLAGFTSLVYSLSYEVGEAHVVGIEPELNEPRPDRLPTAGISYLIKYSDGSILTARSSAQYEWEKAQRAISNAEVRFEGDTRVVSFSQSSIDSNMETFEAMMYPYLEQRLEIGKLSLEIPENALNRAMRFTVDMLNEDELEPLDLGMKNVTGRHQGYRFGPHGAKFNAPITMRLPYDPNISRETAEEDVKTYYFDEETESWIPLEKVGIDAKDHVIISRT
ncbi:MAG: hypothetical protein KAI64_04260, partial [Thermoplasmata archaeon]|nr:hypothetical protein [Thermoplasmata archaeon]